MATTEEAKSTEEVPDMSLRDIIDGDNGRGIPSVKFVADVSEFVETFQPPATAELLIGAYSQLHTKYKSSEASLQGKRKWRCFWESSTSSAKFLTHWTEENLKQKIPELQKSISAIQSLVSKQSQTVRYALSDNIYARATLSEDTRTVHLWLGANVMLEYTYEEALEFLQTNFDRAERDLNTITNDLAFVRDQIVTSEVNMSRIFNWDVRRKRGLKHSNE